MNTKQVTFGDLKPGDLFALMPDAFDEKAHGKQFLNVKLGGHAAWRDSDNVRDEYNEKYPFNVVALDEGRPRFFRDEEKVFIKK